MAKWDDVSRVKRVLAHFDVGTLLYVHECVLAHALKEGLSLQEQVSDQVLLQVVRDLLREKEGENLHEVK